MLLNAAKCRGYMFYRFCVIKGKSKGVKITQTTTQIRDKINFSRENLGEKEWLYYEENVIS